MRRKNVGNYSVIAKTLQKSNQLFVPYLSLEPKIASLEFEKIFEFKFQMNGQKLNNDLIR
jgi:hypothetical protein